MKVKILNVVVIVLLNICYTIAQVYKGSFQEIYFYREPSAAAEATGKTFLFINNDAFASIYNPSLSSLTNDINLSYTNSKKLDFFNNAYYQSAALDFPIKCIGVLSASLRLYNMGEEIEVTTVEQPDGMGRFARFIESIYNINIAKEIIPGFHLGIGINYLNYEFFSDKHDFYSANIGLSFLQNFNCSEVLKHKLFAGAAVNNFVTYSSNNTWYSLTLPGNITGPTYKIYLPQISIFTLGYSIDYTGIELIKNMNDITASVQVEHFRVLNSNKYRRNSIGTELQLLEILIARFGYYTIEYPSYKMEDFTYGLGLNIPLHSFSNLPLSIGIDYTNLGQDSQYFHFQNFNSFTINVNYKI